MPDMPQSHRPKIGLALGMGGARGWCHIGVLRELDRIGIQPDMIAGASMGAVIGAVYAAGALDGLEAFARSITRQKYLTMLDFRLSEGGLIGGGEIRRTFERLGMPDRIEDLPIPFAAVATRMRDGHEHWFREGPLAPAIRASAAMPGVISPHLVDGERYLDGGLVNPVPTSAVRAMGADVLIAVNPTAKLHGRLWNDDPRPQGSILGAWRERLANAPGIFGQPPDPERPATPSYFETVVVSFDVMIEQVLRGRLAAEPPSILLNADLSDVMTILEFDRAAEAIDEGARVTRANESFLRAVTGLDARGPA